MARSNYSYAKRMRELAKKRKKEEKLQRRQMRKTGENNGPGTDPDSARPEGTPG